MIISFVQMNAFIDNLRSYFQDTAALQVLFREVFVILIITLPLSVLVYMFFGKSKQRILVDLGRHKWIVKQ